MSGHSVRDARAILRQGNLNYKRPESILVAVHTGKGDALMLRRVAPFQFWQSVTGSMKWDESSPIHAAVRELREETGIDAAVSDIRDWNRTFKFEILPSVRHRYPPGMPYNVEHMFSLCLDDVREVRLSLKEHDKYRWEHIEKAIKTVWSWSNRRALELIAQDAA